MIEESENRITYLGDGAATEFAIPFSFLEKEDIVVVTVSPESRTETLEKDYFVDADKKAVIYPGYPPGEDPPESERPPVLPAGWKLVIYRNIAVTQKSSLGSIWPFNLIEDGLDKLTMICQDILFSTKRMLKLPESIDEFDPTLPEDLKAGQSIAVNQEGTGWRATRSPEDAADEAADSAAAALASEQAAKKSEDAAKASENAALESQTAAKESENAAARSEEAAAISEDAAKTSEINAKSSEEAAAASESAAKASEEAASQSESNAAGSEESAAASAQAAAKSQELALGSANAAALSEQHAATSEENAANSEAAAAESAARAEQAAGGVGDPVISVEENNGKVTVETAKGNKNEFWTGLNTLQRNKEYAVGDIAYSPNLKSYQYLECITAGTTGDTEPDFSTVVTGGVINDGTLRFILRTIKDTAMTGDITFRPYVAPGWVKAVGDTVNRADYLTLTKFADDYDLWTDTPAEEPWKFGNGDGSTTMTLPDYRTRVIQGGGTVEAREAGLPNIVGYFDARKWNTGSEIIEPDNKLFVASQSDKTSNAGTIQPLSQKMGRTTFDASKSNPIYGSSETVQPPAIVLIPQIKI